MYKIYCSILNSRLNAWSENNDKVSDEQNGFRKGRSTTDQVLCLTNLIETRKKLRKSHFCAFIDFKKAYDTIDRSILWKRLSDIGISGKMFGAVKL
jgi:sorting nexin-29